MKIGHHIVGVHKSALDWFAKERGGKLAEDTAEYEQWLSERENRQEDAELRALWDSLDHLRTEPAMLTHREAALAAIASRQARRRFVRSIAAVLVLAVCIGFGRWGYEHFSFGPPSAGTIERFATRQGQTGSVELIDGSLAILDTDSEIRARMGDAGAREVEVVRGRAMFEVRKANGRRFAVDVGETRVIAIGTKFDVYRKHGSTEINLLEGRLRIEPRTSSAGAGHGLDLVSGDRLVIESDRWQLLRGKASLYSGWASGQLTFDDVPITAIVAELNRYTRRPIIVDAPEVGRRRMSAVIRTHDPLMFLRAVRTMGIAQVREEPRGHVLVLP